MHEQYFQPVHEEFQARTMWSLSNAFTSAFKEFDMPCISRSLAALRRFYDHLISSKIYEPPNPLLHAEMGRFTQELRARCHIPRRNSSVVPLLVEFRHPGAPLAPPPGLSGIVDLF